MVVTCEQVWREVSNFLEGEIDSGMRAAIAEHLRGCKHCTAVVDGTRNVIQVYGDERLFDVPLRYSQRLHRRLEAEMPRRRGTALGWMVAFAGAAILVLAFEVGNSSAFSPTELRSAHAQPVRRPIPAKLAVVVTAGAKVFHLPGCDVIHNKGTERTLTAEEAEREGYVPCVRCLRKYVSIAMRNGVRRMGNLRSAEQMQQAQDVDHKLSMSFMDEDAELGEQRIRYSKLRDREARQSDLAQAEQAASEL
jgi:Putative zinc-finger